jgi:hypothetical protein
VDWSLIRIYETNKVLIGESVRNFDDNISTFYVLSSGNVPFNQYAYKNSMKVKTLLGLHRGINYFSAAICPLETSGPRCSHYSDTGSWTPNGLHVYTELERDYTV